MDHGCVPKENEGLCEKIISGIQQEILVGKPRKGIKLEFKDIKICEVTALFPEVSLQDNILQHTVSQKESNYFPPPLSFKSSSAPSMLFL